MTNEEALNLLKSNDIIMILNVPDAKDVLTEPKQVLEFALEKQIPKKVIEGYLCPNCGADVINQADNDYLFENCYHCGQSLNWDLEKETKE